MKNHKTVRLYNVMFPIWMILFLPSKLWLWVIPANFIIDSIVLYFGTKDWSIVRNHSWKTCIIGFVCDFIGALILLGLLIFSDHLDSESFFANAVYDMSMNPFKNIFALLILLAVVALVGYLIYVMNRWMLRKFTKLDENTIHHACLLLAVITAPWLYFLPTTLLYH